MPRSSPRHNGHPHHTRRPVSSPRHAPALATTLVAAALAGELVVGVLAPGTAGAQAEEPAHEAAAQSDDGPREPAHDAPDPEPEREPDAPADQPDAPEASPDRPPAPSVPAPAEAPAAIRTGYATPAALDSTPAHAAETPLAVPRALPDAAPRATPRDGHESRSDNTAARGGHEAQGHAGPARPVGREHAPSSRRTPTREPAARRRSARASTPRPTEAVPDGPHPSEHTIAPGEHLWGIASARVAEVAGRDAAALAPEEIAGYWTRLCMTNAARLRSGNPSLIYPGEVIELPRT